jgi:hypothetical protein
MKTADPQSPGPSASLVETEETPGWIERDPNALKPTAEWHVQPEYSFD